MAFRRSTYVDIRRRRQSCSRDWLPFRVTLAYPVAQRAHALLPVLGADRHLRRFRSASAISSEVLSQGHIRWTHLADRFWQVGNQVKQTNPQPHVQAIDSLSAVFAKLVGNLEMGLESLPKGDLPTKARVQGEPLHWSHSISTRSLCNIIWGSSVMVDLGTRDRSRCIAVSELLRETFESEVHHTDWRNRVRASVRRLVSYTPALSDHTEFWKRRGSRFVIAPKQMATLCESALALDLPDCVGVWFGFCVQGNGETMSPSEKLSALDRMKVVLKRLRDIPDPSARVRVAVCFLRCIVVLRGGELSDKKYGVKLSTQPALSKLLPRIGEDVRIHSFLEEDDVENLSTKHLALFLRAYASAGATATHSWEKSCLLEVCQEISESLLLDLRWDEINTVDASHCLWALATSVIRVRGVEDGRQQGALDCEDGKHLVRDVESPDREPDILPCSTLDDYDALNSGFNRGNLEDIDAQAKFLVPLGPILEKACSSLRRRFIGEHQKSLAHGDKPDLVWAGATFQTIAIISWSLAVIARASLDVEHRWRGPVGEALTSLCHQYLGKLEIQYRSSSSKRVDITHGASKYDLCHRPHSAQELSILVWALGKLRPSGGKMLLRKILSCSVGEANNDRGTVYKDDSQTLLVATNSWTPQNQANLLHGCAALSFFGCHSGSDGVLTFNSDEDIAFEKKEEAISFGGGSEQGSHTASRDHYADALGNRSRCPEQEQLLSRPCFFRRFLVEVVSPGLRTGSAEYSTKHLAIIGHFYATWASEEKQTF
ncbi:unnamed protein product [Amoebophrya sp. A25]|nr:unnamed protein product [Amoebophrya sp. A25]|eukprot:GSA25T00005361001.1